MLAQSMKEMKGIQCCSDMTPGVSFMEEDVLDKRKSEEEEAVVRMEDVLISSECKKQSNVCERMM